MERRVIVRLRAEQQPELRATLLETRPLLYASGASPEIDRPAHVRAASGLYLHRAALVLVQDDANFIAIVHTPTMQVESRTLPAGPGARRQFDDTLRNKRAKLDLEAAVVLPPDRLIAFGSGATSRRESIVTVDLGSADTQPEVVRAPHLYAALRAEPRFAGSELNVEGAVLIDGCVRLFNRGNGRPINGITPVNATIDIDVAGLLLYLRAPADAPAPALRNLCQFELGHIAGLGLSFTDATTIGSILLYTAVAELSPDATRDGPVAGSAIGVIAEDVVRWTAVRDRAGAIVPIKAEGIALDPAHPQRVLIVIDHDDPTRPSDLCTVQLDGPWPHFCMV